MNQQKMQKEKIWELQEIKIVILEELSYIELVFQVCTVAIFQILQRGINKKFNIKHK